MKSTSFFLLFSLCSTFENISSVENICSLLKIFIVFENIYSILKIFFISKLVMKLC
jgi:hypothetical protein